jgi:ribosomal protein S18 acetylase RimI-like enzyme
VIIELACLQDAEEILELQKIAYLSEAEIYDDYSIPPLKQTIEQIKADFETRLFLKASTKARIVGSVKGHMEEETCFIERLVVHPEFRKQGIGTQLIKEIEARFERARRYELFTGHKSEDNLRLYKRLGYKPCKEKKISDSVTLVFMEKIKNNGR